MFDMKRSGVQSLLDSADARGAANSPCRIAADACDMTCGDRVLDLFDRCRRAMRAGAQHIVIDLHTVTSADTKIVACLVALYQIARSGTARLEVRMSRSVQEVARICRLERMVQELESTLRSDMAADSRMA